MLNLAWIKHIVLDILFSYSISLYSCIRVRPKSHTRIKQKENYSYVLLIIRDLDRGRDAAITCNTSVIIAT
jgi:hypothetical protein